MKIKPNINLTDVQKVYSGFEGQLWEYVMGEQIHIGGFSSSLDLATQAGIKANSIGIDLCCCSGAGIRFLIKMMNVKHMTGVDATPRQLELFKERMAEIGISNQTDFVCSDVASIPLPDESYDFVWGEDAWVYVEHKDKMIAEGTRLLKKGGVMAFTDWVEGEVPMSDTEADRFMAFMKFPNIYNIDDYKTQLCKNGLNIEKAYHTKRYAPCIDLYLRMLFEQHMFDALRILHFDAELLNALAGEMHFIKKLADENKIIQALFVARKTL